MEVSFDELGEGLINSGYQKVAFLEVECNIHGAYRVGVSEDEVLGDQFDCPECHAPRPCSGVIGRGYSRQSLPFNERWCGPGNWNFQAREN
jgi:hypothetical protein